MGFYNLLKYTFFNPYIQSVFYNQDLLPFATVTNSCILGKTLEILSMERLCQRLSL